MHQLYNSYRTFLKKRFNGPVLKIPLNAGFSCPNRDGLKSSTGCAFCDNRAFSPVAETRALAAAEQLAQAIAASSGHYNRFIAYLQPYSNTYASVEYLHSVYEPVIAVPGVVGLAIGTRPDCITPEMISYFEDLSSRTFLSIELGLQSGSDHTLALNNRGHTYDDFVRAVTMLSKTGCEIVAHVMLGLPGDDETTMLATASKLAELPVQGIKIHQLMVVRGTLIEQWYNQGTLIPLTLDTYAHLAGEFLGYVRPDQQIHRIMADSKSEHGLIAPMWSADKLQSVRYIRASMERHGQFQGKYWNRVVDKRH